MSAPSDDVARQLVARGFHVTYRSTAIRILAHPDLPGVAVRLGTVSLVVERDGHEVYRAPLARFDLDAALSRITASGHS
ncbi:MAG TPA: hypothetical protein VFN57_11785 [Thermomicrobiaceae bacterium]|nr:hypothetical protein [Thermomicrobiaceae bacterium]